MDARRKGIFVRRSKPNRKVESGPKWFRKYRDVFRITDAEGRPIDAVDGRREIYLTHGQRARQMCDEWTATLHVGISRENNENNSEYCATLFRQPAKCIGCGHPYAFNGLSLAC